MVFFTFLARRKQHLIVVAMCVKPLPKYLAVIGHCDLFGMLCVREIYQGFGPDLGTVTKVP